MLSQQDIPPKKLGRESHIKPPISPHRQTTPSEYLDPWPTFHVLVGYKQVVSWSFVHALLYLCLFLFGLHAISAALALSGSVVCISLCLSFIVWRIHGLLGSCLLPFIPSWAGYCPGEGFYPHNLLGLRSCLSSSWPWAFQPLILPYCFIVFATALSCLYFSLCSWACQLVFLPYQPIDPPIPLQASLTRLLHFFFKPLFTLLGLLLDSLDFLGPFTTFLPLITFMGLLALILAMSTQLSLPLYSLDFLGLFTFSLSLIIPISLPFCSLGFLDLLTSSIPLVTFMGLLAINPATLAHQACYLIFLPFCPSFSSHLSYCWDSFAAGSFLKNGHQQYSLYVV